MPAGSLPLRSVEVACFYLHHYDGTFLMLLELRVAATPPARLF